MHSLAAGRRSRAGSGSVDSGGEERLHQFTQLQPLLCLCVYSDSCRGHCDSDRDHRLLCHPERDEESVDCGELAQSHLTLASLQTDVALTPFDDMKSDTQIDVGLQGSVYTHNLKVNPC